MFSVIIKHPHHTGSSQIMQELTAQEEKKPVVYKEQYKATMVDQDLDEAKVVEGERHTKSKAP